MNIETTYNERSWAIDLIGYIKELVNNNNRSIKDAGGEHSLRSEGGMLYPDVLLFGDKGLGRILQGWELKMPDTSIDDHEFRLNAERKANTLGLDSYLLWNVSHARLYVKNSITGVFSSTHQWNTLSYISTRAAVIRNRSAWEALAAEIIAEMNDLFDRNSLEGRRFVDAYRSGGITGLILANTDAFASALLSASRRDTNFGAQITLWWNQNQSEYMGDDKWKVLGQANLSNWIGKFLFAHLLQTQDKRAQTVTQIVETSTPTTALSVFRDLSQQCNFWTIFSDSVGLSVIPAQAWNQLIQLNRLLADLRVGSIEQAQLSDILEATVMAAVRRLRGQYPTPPPLARLLVHLCVRNIEDDRLLDPCCGSGTIVRAALEQKLQAEVTPNTVAASVFAGDQDAQAVQIATFAMAKPALMHMPLRIFCRDAFSLRPDTSIDFRNPSNGQSFTEQVGKFDAIASNLPFIAQEGRVQYGNAINVINGSFAEGLGKLSGRTDISGYLPFALHPLLKDSGRLGIIITNSWLGTDWGNTFFELIKHYYKLKSVITSGAGRWFKNSQVVTNILILEKREDPVTDEEEIDFVVLMRPIEEFSDQDAVSVAAAQIELGRTQNDTMTIRSVSWSKIARFKECGLDGSAQFVNCDWVLDLPLIKLSQVCRIRRGERRGWDRMFYPRQGHGIEQEYIKPVLRSSTEISGYIASARSDAFSCSLTIDELTELGHTGAIQWINRFRDGVNRTNKPLPQALARHGLQWYEMSADEMAEMVVPMNIDKRFYVARLDVPSFVNQRLIVLSPTAGGDLDLLHALLNSAISWFMIEGSGFGRGLGVLDINPTQMKKFLHILNPSILSAQNAVAIKEAFQPLLARNIRQVADELEQSDRKNFDDTVIAAFGVSALRDSIYDDLIKLVSIRQAALQTFD